MFTRTKYFFCLFVLQCPTSLLIPLAQQDLASTSNTDNLVVLETNKNEQVTPNNLKVTELLQQIDVKDDENLVISNINHVVVSDENIQNDNNETQNNGTNNMYGLKNNSANETITNVLNTTNNANVNNATIKEVRKVQNGSTSDVNVSSTLAPNTNIASKRTTISISSENIASISASLENKETGVPTLATFDGENTLHEIFIDGYNEIENISSAEAPAFKSLIPDKTRKLQQVSNVVNNEFNETKDHNLILKLSPDSPPMSVDLNRIPLNNLLGGVLSFMKRLKRNTHDKVENSYPWETNCKSKQIDEHHTVKSCKTPQSFKNVLTIKTIPSRKSFDDNIIFNVLKLYDTVELACPLSVIVKLYTHQVLDRLAKSDPDSDSVLNRILISFVKGDEDAINLASKELSDLPIPIKLRLQLVHGKTKEFLEQLSDIVDATLCSLP